MTNRTEETKVDDALDRAIAEVGRLNVQEHELAVLYRRKADELAMVRAKRGDEVLDGVYPAGAARESGRRVRGLLEEVEAIADGAGRARARRIAAIPAVFVTEADERLREAAKLEAEATTLEVDSGRLREALEAHDGCRYVAAPPVAPDRAIGGQVGGAPTVVLVSAPRHERLRGEAAALRTQAGQLRVREPHTAGSVDGDDLEALLAAVFEACSCAVCRGRAGMRIGPEVADIVAWSELAIATERARRARVAEGADALPADAAMRLHLEWRRGAIDAGGSRILLPVLAEDGTALYAAELAELEGLFADGEVGESEPAKPSVKVVGL